MCLAVQYVAGAINRNVCMNSVENENRQNFLTYAGMHGQNNRQKFVCGGNNINNDYEHNCRQENLSGFVTEACTMPNNVIIIHLFLRHQNRQRLLVHRFQSIILMKTRWANSGTWPTYAKWWHYC